MSSKGTKFYLTTAIDYVNASPHIGTAYEKIGADFIARSRRLLGEDVRFLMGNDEHSVNVARAAAAEGLSPLAYCDRMERRFREVWELLDISFDDFVRTTEERHRRAVGAIFAAIHAAGDIYKGKYEGYYCDSCEGFKQEKDLVDGLCPLHKRAPRWLVEGLGTLFEARGVWQSRIYQSQPDRINRDRLEDWRTYAKSRRRPDAIAQLVSSDRPFAADPDGAYAEAWALSFFLSETSPKKYFELLGKSAARPAFADYSSATRLEDFTDIFGADLTLLDAHFRRFVAGLK